MNLKKKKQYFTSVYKTYIKSVAKSMDYECTFVETLKVQMLLFIGVFFAFKCMLKNEYNKQKTQ